MKVCRKCQDELPLDLFPKDRSKPDGHYSFCKSCHREKSSLHKAANPELYRQKDKSYMRAHRKELSEKYRLRYQNDPLQRLKKNLRNRLTMAVKIGQRAGSAVSDLGCSIQELRNHLEMQFQPGMSWDNWGRGPGKWHIDHRVPLTAFDLTDREQILKACHYTNLQPLWSEDNIRKGGANRG